MATTKKLDFSLVLDSLKARRMVAQDQYDESVKIAATASEAWEAANRQMQISSELMQQIDQLIRGIETGNGIYAGKRVSKKQWEKELAQQVANLTLHNEDSHPIQEPIYELIGDDVDESE